MTENGSVAESPATSPLSALVQQWTAREDACDAAIHQQLQRALHQGREQSVRVREAAVLAQQGHDELVRLLELARDEAGRAQAATRELRRYDRRLRHAESALQLVRNLLRVRACAEGIRVALAERPPDIERACAHAETYRQLWSGSDNENGAARQGVSSMAAASAGGLVSLAPVEESIQRLQQLVREQAAAAAAAHKPSSSSTRSESILLWARRLRQAGLEAEARQFLVQHAVQHELYPHREMSPEAVPREWQGIQRLTLLYESVATALHRYSGVLRAEFGGDEAVSALVAACVQHCNQHGAPLVQQFLREERVREQLLRARAALEGTAAGTAASGDGEPHGAPPAIFADLSASMGSDIHAFIEPSTAGAAATSPSASAVGLSDTDMHRLDGLLERIAVIGRRTGTFAQFLRACDPTHPALTDMQRRDGTLPYAVQELLGYYVGLEDCYLQESVRRAERADQAPQWVEANTSGPRSTADAWTQRTSSLVDDAFFVLKKCLMRTVSVHDVNTLGAVLNHVNALLSGPLRQTLAQRVRTRSPSSALLSAQLMLGGSLKPGTLDALLVAINDAQVSAEYGGKMAARVLPAAMQEAQLPDTDKVMPLLAEMEGAAGELEVVAGRGLDALMAVLEEAVLTRAASQSRLDCEVSAVGGTERGSDGADRFVSGQRYLVSEAEYVAGPSAPVASFLAAITAGALDPFADKLVPAAWQQLVCRVSEWTARRYQRATLGRATRFNALGALVWDAEVRALTAHFISRAPTQRLRIREHFRVLSLAALVLNLDKPGEVHSLWEEVQSAGAAEVRGWLSRRVEFSPEVIQALKWES
ncbi:hypothetical protein CDCA_CDCA09G2784 [Cyanidium caldarium]|uniref:COG4 transport protein middle alpha-helical bundle domain-containing protein n=1 Tax=Cyanidium caldarium TaxID=2771 RepID=A0AAV9IWV9_CYACA|nr:hypothetical protein CDCA_CDCA09G2784 [Cyanidium caldarium]|eukprot:ctg_2165.g427